jgi:hypothetical protein
LQARTVRTVRTVFRPAVLPVRTLVGEVEARRELVVDRLGGRIRCGVVLWMDIYLVRGRWRAFPLWRDAGLFCLLQSSGALARRHEANLFIIVASRAQGRVLHRQNPIIRWGVFVDVTFGGGWRRRRL